MQLGLSTYTFPWAIGFKEATPALAAFDLLQTAHAHQVKNVQFGDNLPLHLWAGEELKKLRERATALHIRVEVGARGLKSARLLQYLSIAQQFHAPFLRIVIDDVDYEPDATEVIGVIKKVLPHFKEAGVPLAIENHDRFPAKTIKRIIESTDPQWVAVCLDTANSLGANEGINEVLAQVAPYTINLHIKDILIRRVQSKMGFTVEGCIAGKGQLNIPDILENLKRHSKCKTATLEQWCPASETPEKTIAQEQAWAEKSITYLKNIVT